MNKSFFGFSKYGIGTLLLAFLLAAILGVGIGYIAQPSPSQKVIKKAVESSPPSLQENFEFVSPQAVLPNTKAINKLEIVGLDSLVLTKISVALQTKKARAVSVYFQDLSNGKSWTINPNEKYTPASLMKVSVLLAILKTSESRPEMLHQELFFAQKQQANYTSEGSQGMELESQLIPERKYQVQHLIEEMIINSDNEATFLLLDFLEKTNKNELLEVERLFDILPPDNNIKAEDFITVSAYSRLFRTLYNASFLSVENSDYALELLSKAIF